MSERPTRISRRALQSTLLRILIATAGVAAVTVTVQQIAARNRIDGPLPIIIIGVCFAGAFLITTVKGEWWGLLAICIIFFPVAIAAAFAPSAAIWTLFGSLALISLISIVESRSKSASPKTKETEWGSFGIPTLVFRMRMKFRSLRFGLRGLIVVYSAIACGFGGLALLRTADMSYSHASAQGFFLMFGVFALGASIGAPIGHTINRTYGALFGALVGAMLFFPVILVFLCFVL